MKHSTVCTAALIAAGTFLTNTAHARSELVSNGGFESGFSGWTRVDQLGSGGSFLDQTGLSSPLNGLAVQAPSEGTHAAMTDGDAPGTHILYQDVFIPTGMTQGTLRFSLFINNTAAAFSTPATLDWSTPALNQQARVDIIRAAADPFSVLAADIFQNLFQTAVGSPLVTGYNPFTVDISPLIVAHGGETIRLRFAEADNVNIFNFGVDAVSLDVVPSPSSGLLALPVLLFSRRSRR